MVKEINGIMTFDINGDIQRVQIMDDPKYIKIFHTGQQHVLLSAEDSRHLASELIKAANRLEKRLKQ